MKTILITIFSVLSIITSYGQHSGYKKAEKYFNQFEYAAAAEAFEAIALKDPADVHVWERLAMCYDKLNNSQKAEVWLARLCNSQETPAYYYKSYAKVLASNGNYTASALWYKKYLLTVPDKHATHTIDVYGNIGMLYEDSSFYSIALLPLNSPQSDFSPAFYENGLIFCSSRMPYKSKATYRWDNSSFIDLYWVKDNETKSTAFEKPINSIMHEGPATFTPQYDTLYFTRNSSTLNTKPASKDDIIKLKIFYSIKKNGAWQKEQSLPINADNFSVGHPALSPDHKLYFASDMPGGFGGTDIYYTRFVNGQCTPPVNLGPEINTPGNEMFPFLDLQGNLYFASNTHPGLGGLDIFYSKKEQNNFLAPQNIGSPINSSKDDFGLIIRDRDGFFSSNRGSSSDDDNIYSFIVDKTKSLSIQPFSQGGKPVTDFNILITENELSDKRHVDAIFRKTFNCEKSYTIQVAKEGYQNQSITLDGQKLRSLHQNDTIRITLPDAMKTFQIALLPSNTLFEKNEIGETIELEIRYDVGKSTIRKDAAKELDKLVTFLKTNPTVKVELGSHTDVRGSEEANHNLSQKRAEAAVRYLISKNVSSSLLLPIGYGETDPKIKDATTEEDHQKNRRTTIKIVGFKD